jgi:hypothetical protein
MTSDDRTPDITKIVMAPNYTTIYRNGRFQPVVPDPPLPADFNAWLVAGLWHDYYRMYHPELAEATLVRSRARLIAWYRQRDDG